jgi:4-hydroxy-tetrahydrodipicolinate synthase
VNWTHSFHHASLVLMPLHGILVPLITPFTAAGGVAADALQALARDVLDEGATGIVVLGTTA